MSKSDTGRFYLLKRDGVVQGSFIKINKDLTDHIDFDHTQKVLVTVGKGRIEVKPLTS
jgi:hypothetical protein